MPRFFVPDIVTPRVSVAQHVEPTELPWSPSLAVLRIGSACRSVAEQYDGRAITQDSLRRLEGDLAVALAHVGACGRWELRYPRTIFARMDAIEGFVPVLEPGGPPLRMRAFVRSNWPNEVRLVPDARHPDPRVPYPIPDDYWS